MGDHIEGNKLLIITESKIIHFGLYENVDKDLK